MDECGTVSPSLRPTGPESVCGPVVFQKRSQVGDAEELVLFYSVFVSCVLSFSNIQCVVYTLIMCFCESRLVVTRKNSKLFIPALRVDDAYSSTIFRTECPALYLDVKNNVKNICVGEKTLLITKCLFPLAFTLRVTGAPVCFSLTERCCGCFGFGVFISDLRHVTLLYVPHLPVQYLYPHVLNEGPGVSSRM